MCFPISGYIGSHCIRAEIKHIAITSAAKQNCVAEISFKFTRNEVAADHPSCFSINHNDFQHFMPGVHFYITQSHLSFEGLVSPYQQLLAGLACSIKRSLYLRTTK